MRFFLFRILSVLIIIYKKKVRIQFSTCLSPCRDKTDFNLWFWHFHLRICSFLLQTIYTDHFGKLLLFLWTQAFTLCTNVWYCLTSVVEETQIWVFLSLWLQGPGQVRSLPGPYATTGKVRTWWAVNGLEESDLKGLANYTLWLVFVQPLS